MERTLYRLGWMLLAFASVCLIIVHFTGFLSLPCLLYSTTGIYCPGCGGTRAVWNFLHGHWLRAFYYHPFVPYCGILFGWFMLSQTIERVSKGKLCIGMKYRNGYLYFGLFLVLANWIARNLWIPIS